MLVYKGRSAFRARVSGRDGCGHTCNVARGQVVSVADVGLAARLRQRRVSCRGHTRDDEVDDQAQRDRDADGDEDGHHGSARNQASDDGADCSLIHRPPRGGGGDENEVSRSRNLRCSSRQVHRQSGERDEPGGEDHRRARAVQSPVRPPDRGAHPAAPHPPPPIQPDAAPDDVHDHVAEERCDRGQ